MARTDQPTSPGEAKEQVDEPPTVEDVIADIFRAVSGLVEWILACKTLTFLEFEQQRDGSLVPVQGENEVPVIASGAKQSPIFGEKPLA